MRDIVTKKIKIDNIWSRFSAYNPGSSYVVFEVDHRLHRITFDFEGRNIPSQTFWGLCLSDKDLMKEIKWGMLEACRSNPAKVVKNGGMSGAATYSVVSMGNHYTNTAKFFAGEKVAMLHISSEDKIEPKFMMWAGDLAVLLYAIDKFGFSKKAAVYPLTREIIPKPKNIVYIPIYDYSYGDDVISLKNECWEFSTPNAITEETIRRERKRRLRRRLDVLRERSSES